METPNLSYIESMSRGDEAFVRKILGLLKGEFPQELAVYNNNYNAGNFHLASENVHKIKHKISLLGLEKSYVVATDYENSLKEGVTELHGDFEKITQAMTEYLLTI